MNIYYEDNIGIIYNNDCREIIKCLKFDYILTDPPYNINYKYNNYKDNLNSDEYIKLLGCMKDYKSIVIHYPEIFCGDLRDALGRPNKIINWCYNSNTNKQHRSIGFYNCNPNLNLIKQPYKNLNDKRIKKLIADGSSGSKLYDWWNDIMQVKNVSKEKVKGFTNQIPLKLLERILLLTTKENDIILDPFFGSGSLYFACKNTNRRCIGIEKSKNHLQFFSNRL